MKRFTVISFYTPDFACFASGLKQDCEKFGYAHEIREVEESASLVDTWDRKVDFIGEAINRHGAVLWLDVECRLLAPVPENWSAPLTSTFPMGGSCPVSTGVLLLDRPHQPLVKVWSRHARKYPELPDDFVLEFLLREYDLPFNYIETEFFDRRKMAQIVRGQWQGKGIVVQHPTINRWPDPARYHHAFNGKELSSEPDPAMRVARKRKSLFWRNFGGDFEEVEHIMSSGVNEEREIDGWIFHPACHQYAPRQYWPDLAEVFGVKPLTLAKFIEHTQNGFKENIFRTKMLRKMRLSREEKSLYPLRKSSFFRKPKFSPTPMTL